MEETSSLTDAYVARLNSGTSDKDKMGMRGHYDMKCYDSEGNLLWEDGFDNLVTTAGKNALLNVLSATATLVGPFMGLISSVSWTSVNVTDTMASHTGWTECNATNAPSYGATRPTVTYNAASGGSIVSNAASFVFTNSGTVEGAFQCAYASATASNTQTLGTLFNAGTLATAQPVVSTNTLTVTYTLTLT